MRRVSRINGGLELSTTSVCGLAYHWAARRVPHAKHARSSHSGSRMPEYNYFSGCAGPGVIPHRPSARAAGIYAASGDSCGP